MSYMSNFLSESLSNYFHMKGSKLYNRKSLLLLISLLRKKKERKNKKKTHQFNPPPKKKTTTKNPANSHPFLRKLHFWIVVDWVQSHEHIITNDKFVKDNHLYKIDKDQLFESLTSSRLLRRFNVAELRPIRNTTRSILSIRQCTSLST